MDPSTQELSDRRTSSLAFAYTVSCNPRRAEAHLYGFWLIELQRLISTCPPNFFVVPQAEYFYARRYLNQKKFLPDFAIISTPSVPASVALPNWQVFDVSNTNTRSRALAEIKRIPSRDLDYFDSFFKVLNRSMLEAQGKLYDRYAPVAFKTFAGGMIVLIAGVGEWWSYRIVFRPTTPSATSNEETSELSTAQNEGNAQEESYTTDVTMEGEGNTSDAEKETKENSDVEEEDLSALEVLESDNDRDDDQDDQDDLEQLSEENQSRFIPEMLHHPDAEPLIGPNPVFNIHDKTVKWSGYLLVGTPTSEFHFNNICTLIP